MKRLGIKFQIILIALVPVFFIDVFFTYIQINSNIEQANQLLQSKGQIIARQIAGASEFNLYSGHDSQIKYLLDQSIDTNDIVLASIYDHQGQLITEAVSSEFDPAEVTEYFYYREPIMSESIEITDVFSPDLDHVQQTEVLGWVHLYISNQQLQQTTRQIIVESVTFFLSILVIAIIVTIIISRRVTQPIIRLMEHLKFVETGQLGKSIEPIEPNEIGSVQKGFNRMTHALLANRRHLNLRIQQATHQLSEAITDLETKNRELGFARDEAQNANETKSKFIANMSHEIRTPINGIKGFISLLGQSSLNQTQQRYIDIILKSTNDLTGIVNEILDFSKMESGKLQIVDEVFDLYEVIEQTRDIMFINVLTKNIDLNLIIYSDTPRWVIGDKLRLKQILLNLVGNAIKFTDQGEVIIRVSIQQEHDDAVELLISIEDSGIGITQQDQENLFLAFSQVDSSNNRRFTGTGLGLVIIKNLAKLMGGDISMQSTLGKGSKFELCLPFKVNSQIENSIDNNLLTSTAFILGSNLNCVTESRCLFDRAGLHTETQLVDINSDSNQIREIIQRNWAYIDFLVFDMRHLDIKPEQFIGPQTDGSPRVIAMHYDHNVDSAVDSRVEFISVINTSETLHQLLSQPVKDEINKIEETPLPDGKAKQVLLVDDNPINLKLGSELIRLWGHHVIEAEHGNEAMQIYREQAFDLIVLDIQMPDIDGASLLHMMREHKPQDTTPIVALTANIMQDEADRLLELGFDYFLSKPIDEDRFRALIDGRTQRRMPSSQTDEVRESPDCSVDYQRSLALSADNTALLKQIFEILQRDIPDHRQHLKNALAAGQQDKLATIAHKLNGVTCYASLPRLRHKVLSFQQRLSRDNNLKMNQAVQELDEELSTVKQEVDRYLEQMTIE